MASSQRQAALDLFRQWIIKALHSKSKVSIRGSSGGGTCGGASVCTTPLVSAEPSARAQGLGRLVLLWCAMPSWSPSVNDRHWLRRPVAAQSSPEYKP